MYHTSESFDFVSVPRLQDSHFYRLYHDGLHLFLADQAFYYKPLHCVILSVFLASNSYLTLGKDSFRPADCTLVYLVEIVAPRAAPRPCIHVGLPSVI
jgi:hypothetical protein